MDLFCLHLLWYGDMAKVTSLPAWGHLYLDTSFLGIIYEWDENREYISTWRLLLLLIKLFRPFDFSHPHPHRKCCSPKGRDLNREVRRKMSPHSPHLQTTWELTLPFPIPLGRVAGQPVTYTLTLFFFTRNGTLCTCRQVPPLSYILSPNIK